MEDMDLLLSQLAVKIKAKDGSTYGSGMLLPLGQETLVLTCRHCICSPNDKSDCKIICGNCEWLLSPEEIHIESAMPLKQVYPVKRVMLVEGYDIVILSISAIIPLAISIARPRFEQGCYFKGFPGTLQGISDEAQLCKGSIMDRKKNLFVAQIDNPITEQYQVEGFSGSGVFAMMAGRLTLLGLMCTHKNLNTVECLSLYELVETGRFATYTDSLKKLLVDTEKEEERELSVEERVRLEKRKKWLLVEIDKLQKQIDKRKKVLIPTSNPVLKRNLPKEIESREVGIADHWKEIRKIDKQLSKTRRG